MALRDNKDH